jgi:hypothetical protein
MVMQLPKGLSLPLMQTKWAAILDALLGNPSLNSLILQNVSLSSGANTINHTLGRTLTGWRIIRLRASATMYDQQDSNPHPDLTLVLVSSASAVVDLEVF